MTVKGKSEPIEVWQIHDFDAPQKEPLYAVSYEMLQEELRLHHEAIALYKEARFAEALTCFKALQQRETKTNQAIYTIYMSVVHTISRSHQVHLRVFLCTLLKDNHELYSYSRRPR